MKNDIAYIKRHEINVDKWDACVAGAGNGLIYAYAWWLDEMATKWDALILGDYEAVMPLTWSKKYGISYLCQPAFTQQLGVISAKQMPVEMVSLFVEKAKTLFRFAEIHLNDNNQAANGLSRNNFIIDLQHSYASLRNVYNKGLKRNIKKAGKHQLVYDNKCTLEDVITLFKNTYSNRNLGVGKKDFDKLGKVLSIASAKGNLLIRAVWNQDKKMCAAALCPIDNKRIYFLLPVISTEAKTTGANHMLLDELIQEYAGKPLLLDMEGSDIPGIADFYKSFGSVNQPYHFLKWNRLPWPLSLLKG